MQIPVLIHTSYFTADKPVLVDSGATNNFMHPKFAKQMRLKLAVLEGPHKIWNADNTKNKEGMITHYLDLDVETKSICKDMRFYIANIGKEDIFLGYPWLAAYEPHFKWKDATTGEEVLPVIICSINPHISRPQLVIAQATLEDLKACIIQQLKEQCCLRTTSTNLAIQARQHTKAVELPPQYQKFTKVFSKKESSCFPPSCSWDHMIEFKKGTPNALDCKVYPMLQDKRWCTEGVGEDFHLFYYQLKYYSLCYTIDSWEKRWSKRLNTQMYAFWYLSLLILFSVTGSGYAAPDHDQKLVLVSNPKYGINEYWFPSMEKVLMFTHLIETLCIHQTRMPPSCNLIITGSDNGFTWVSTGLVVNWLARFITEVGMSTYNNLWWLLTGCSSWPSHTGCWGKLYSHEVNQMLTFKCRLLLTLTVGA